MSENQLKITPEFILGLVLRRRWIILLPLCLALVGGIYYAIVTPRIYQAKTLILVEGQSVPQSFVQSIVTEDTSERINTISQQILSRTNLEKIVDQFSLFSGPGFENMFMEDKVTALRRNIAVNVITDQRRQTDAFEISYKGKDPEKVMRVVNGLTASFIDQNLKVRESQAIGTSTFLESELETRRKRLEHVEEDIKEYRKAHMGELPEQLNTNLAILDRLQSNLSDRQQSLRESKIRLTELKNQTLIRQSPMVVIGGAQQNPPPGGASLDDLIAELESLQARYTDKHPDIIRLKKQIAELESRPQGQSGTDQRHSGVRIPAAVRVQIAEAQREIQVAQREINDIIAQIATYQQRIESTPRREQELLVLRRDYQNIQASYDSLLNRKLEADIAVNMERKQKGEQFRIVDPAKQPERPIEPDMRRIFLIVVGVGLGMGGGLAFLLEFLDKSFKKPEDIEEYFQLPVLATLPILVSHRQVLLRRLNIVGSIAMTLFNLCLLGIFGFVSMNGGNPFASILH